MLCWEWIQKVNHFIKQRLGSLVHFYATIIHDVQTCKITRSMNAILRLTGFLKEMKIAILFILCGIFKRLYVSPRENKRHHCIVVLDGISLAFYILDAKGD